MASTLSWLDHSERDRRRALDVIDLFREQDTRDELGVGSVRDAIAEILFPGTSTIQTRAKYLLFIPWTYLELERLRVPSAQMSERARREEITLIGALAASEQNDGVIGIEARGELKRLPSNVYWLGLRRLGIRAFGGSQTQYHRYLDLHYLRVDVYRNGRRAGDEAGHVEAPRPNWHPGLPPRPAEFPRQASLRLDRSEAEYLRERILTCVPTTLFAHLAGSTEPFEATDFPWDAAITAGVPAGIARQVTHARAFSEVMHGAALLYNLMLARLVPNDELTERYEGRLGEWQALLARRASELAGWDKRDFWNVVTSGGARVYPATRAFIEAWLDLATGPDRLAGRASVIQEEPRALDLISRRERAIKRDRARLHSRTALELWNGDAGTSQLVYRWPQARRIVLDILEGLQEEPASA